VSCLCATSRVWRLAVRCALISVDGGVGLFLVGLIQLSRVLCVAWLRPRPAAPSSGTGISVVNKLVLPAFVLLLAARASMGPSRKTHVSTRTLDSHKPEIYLHPRYPFALNLTAPSVCFTRRLPAPSFFLNLQFTRTLGLFLPGIYRQRPSHTPQEPERTRPGPETTTGDNRASSL